MPAAEWEGARPRRATLGVDRAPTFPPFDALRQAEAFFRPVGKLPNLKVPFSRFRPPKRPVASRRCR